MKIDERETMFFEDRRTASEKIDMVSSLVELMHQALESEDNVHLNNACLNTCFVINKFLIEAKSQIDIYLDKIKYLESKVIHENN